MSIRIDINVCRVCCKPEAANSIHQHAQKFRYCTGLQVSENDALPDKICDVCLERMKTAVDFKRKSEHSDRQLRNFIANVNNQFHMTLVISEDTDDQEIEAVPVLTVQNKKDSTFDERNSDIPEFTNQTNSALGTKAAQLDDRTDEQESDIVLIQDPVPEAEIEPQLEPKLQKEKEKFRAVAVIQEKPLVEPKKEMFEVVEVDYDEDMLQQEISTDVELEQADSQMDDDAEESEHVIYISIPNEYQAEPKLASASDKPVDDGQATGSGEELPEFQVEIEEFKHQTKPQTSHPTKTASSAKAAPNGRFECTQCAKFFSTKTNLNRHLQAHDGNKPYVCPLCRKGFTQNGSLKQHMLIHQNIRPFVCSVCEQGFSQQKSLTFHMRRHTNEKPFVCPHCAFAFRQKDGLKRHMLVKHTERDAKTFNCTECTMTFSTRYGLATHRKRHEIASAAAAEGVSIVMKD
ncbi:zinc finger and SCAN domain-containing protein 2-like [Wyeomyia smithii]|uniref:zinc finger and SCAN domain-containing protein 2-like n=1 Tax=Wyeomyia smithii TaxID=174621 RepID=UPI002467F2D2|nr:zinc finger and SCAN domain-containing protein 2-like [Wyeomyia smithii]XP_055523806.1 zinc finger and SCAN domain-containing protein 2-like [Wyeomyia smithii]